jgi:hypothetical protein|tara:strand:+ start:475 stop:705 length:231 start_codon:yes stop_codon:yes gene_type:complete
MKKFKLTPKILNKIIAEEKAKLMSLNMLRNGAKNSIEDNIKAIEKLSIKEVRLKQQLKLIQETKKKIKNKIIKSRK